MQYNCLSLLTDLNSTSMPYSKRQNCGAFRRTRSASTEHLGIWSTATLMPQRNVGNGVTVSAKCCLSTVTVAQTSFLSVMADPTSALHVRPISCLRGRRSWSIAKILGFRTRSSMTYMTYWTGLNLEYLVFGNPRYRHAKKATALALRRIAIPIG